jgi:hypothetical protein
MSYSFIQKKTRCQEKNEDQVNPRGFGKGVKSFISDLMWWYFLATPLSFLHVFNEAVPQGSYLEDNDLFHRLLGAHKYPVPQTFPCMLFLIRILLRQT